MNLIIPRETRPTRPTYVFITTLFFKKYSEFTLILLFSVRTELFGQKWKISYFIGSYPGELSSKLNPSAGILQISGVKRSQFKKIPTKKNFLGTPGGHNLSI